jgi:hypothetical protein
MPRLPTGATFVRKRMIQIVFEAYDVEFETHDYLWLESKIGDVGHVKLTVYK